MAGAQSFDSARLNGEREHAALAVAGMLPASGALERWSASFWSRVVENLKAGLTMNERSFIFPTYVAAPDRPRKYRSPLPNP